MYLKRQSSYNRICLKCERKLYRQSCMTGDIFLLRASLAFLIFFKALFDGYAIPTKCEAFWKLAMDSYDFVKVIRRRCGWNSFFSGGMTVFRRCSACWWKAFLVGEILWQKIWQVGICWNWLSVLQFQCFLECCFSSFTVWWIRDDGSSLSCLFILIFI